jgi:hypothetical protein
VKDGRSFGAEKIVIEILEGEDKKLDSQLDKSELERLCLSAAISSLVAGPKLEKPFFEQIEAGLKMAKVRALFGPRLGSNQIILVKASPNYFRLSPYHESEAPSWNENPVNIEGWARRLSKARVVFNGGQFYPNRSYMGLLRRSGRDISAKVHSGWKGFLVQEPSPEGQKATIIDLEASPEAKLTINQYPTVIQSFMMFDSLGRLRVRKSRLLASRAMLGIDRDGDFLLVLAPGAMTLVDLADLGAYLGLRQALGLDGGLETQLALKGPSGLRAEVGRYANNFLGNFRIDNFSPSLPSVLALEPLGEGGLD